MINGQSCSKLAGFVLLFLILSLLMTAVTSLAVENVDCADCHEISLDDETVSDYDTILAMSIHEGFECIDCHISISGLPHEEQLQKVNCGECHDAEAEEYQKHGRLETGVAEDIPSCVVCHGSHNILPSDNEKSAVHPLNLHSTCGQCHENLNLIKKHELLHGEAIEVYESSVHGQASAGGADSAATCTDCHSPGGTAHHILGPGDPESSVNHFNIPHTCGKCHVQITNDYMEGIHGLLLEYGEIETPVCTHCHGEHGIISPGDPRSPVNAARLAEATCTPCHEAAYLSDKYGIPSGRSKSWVDSYHGLKSQAGDMTVANCASCHSAHRILPHTNSTSSIHPDNLQSTCGQCHPGISAELAQTPIHGIPGESRTLLADIVSRIYIAMIVIVVGSMVAYCIIDLRKKIRVMFKKTQIRRMQTNEVWQHTLLMFTFITLVITGFSLRYSESWWVVLMFGYEGGFPLRGIIHRVAAVLFMATSVWHIVYLFGKQGKKFIRDIFPAKKDIPQLIKMIEYNLGIIKEEPRFARFSYVEKAEYWALVWGTIVMILTGLLLWFDNYVIVSFSKAFLDVVLVVHFYEAWLATLAILIWHLYSTVFRPSVYPMNPAWLTGKMPMDMYEEEHPAENRPTALDEEGK
jgi:formate dehydrogenase gamma subunit